MSIMDDLDKENAEAWKPEPGDKITGVVVSTDGSYDAGWGEYPIIEIETDQGTRAIHAFHSVLKKELASQKPEVGETIGIKYLGKAKTDAGTEFHKYKVVMDREKKAQDWDAVGQAAEQELDGAEVPVTAEDEAPF